MWDKFIRNYYVVCSLHIGVNQSKTILLHRYLLDIEDSSIRVDHKDRNPLNNLEENLRISTVSQNAQNRKGANKNSKTGVRNVHLI